VRKQKHSEKHERRETGNTGSIWQHMHGSIKQTHVSRAATSSRPSSGNGCRFVFALASFSIEIKGCEKRLLPQTLTSMGNLKVGGAG
jgi:hypothetical protein